MPCSKPSSPNSSSQGVDNSGCLGLGAGQAREQMNSETLRPGSRGRVDTRMSSKNPQSRGCRATSRVSPGSDVSPYPSSGRSLESSESLVPYLQGYVCTYLLQQTDVGTHGATNISSNDSK